MQTVVILIFVVFMAVVAVQKAYEFAVYRFAHSLFIVLLAIGGIAGGLLPGAPVPSFLVLVGLGGSLYFGRVRRGQTRLALEKLQRQIARKQGTPPLTKVQPKSGQKGWPLEEAGAPLTGLLPLEVSVDELIHRTAAGGTLEFHGTVASEIRVAHDPRYAADDVQPLRATTRLWDSDGGVWELGTWINPDAFCEPLFLETHESATLVRWSDAPPYWRNALRDRCIARGVKNLLDSRERYELKIGMFRHIFMQKYQGAVIDLARLSDRELLVRISGLTHEIWEGDQWKDIVPLYPIAFTIDSAVLSPLHAPQHHQQDRNDEDEDEDDERSTRVERSYVFDRAGSGDQKQASVHHRPRA